MLFVLDCVVYYCCGDCVVGDVVVVVCYYEVYVWIVVWGIVDEG